MKAVRGEFPLPRPNLGSAGGLEQQRQEEKNSGAKLHLYRRAGGSDCQQQRADRQTVKEEEEVAGVFHLGLCGRRARISSQRR